MATSKKQKNKSASTRKREPYQRQASVENASARIAYGILFLLLGACTAVSYFVREGTAIINIRRFMSGIFGYGFWALAVCFLWVAIIIFQGSGRSGIRIFCILMIPILFSAFIDVLQFDVPSSAAYSAMTPSADALFVDGQNFKCGGVLSGLLVFWLVRLLSKVGTGIVICILLIVCVAMAVSEPQAWYGGSSKKGNSGKKNGSGGKASSSGAKVNAAKASVSGVAATLGTLWNGESGKGGRPENGRFDPSSLLRMNDDYDGDTLHDLRISEDEREVAHVSQIAPEDEEPVNPLTDLLPELSGSADVPEEGKSLLYPAIPKRPSAEKKRPSPVVRNTAVRNAEYSAPVRSVSAQTAAERGAPGSARGGSRTDPADRSPAPVRFDRSRPTDGRSGRSAAAEQKESASKGVPGNERAGRPVPAADRGNAGSRGNGRPADQEIRRTGDRYEDRIPGNGEGNVRSSEAVPGSLRRSSETVSAAEPRPAKADDPVRESKAPEVARPGGDQKNRIAASTKGDIKEQKQVTAKEARSAARTIASQISKASADDFSEYEFPPSSLLRAAKAEESDSEREIYENKTRLENALHSFGVNSQVVKFTHGPTVTRYDIELEQGVKLTKVTNLSNDLALALGVTSVRIAPIPDEISTVGIEVPNKIVNTVSLKELIESDNFSKATSKLSFAIGKDIGGTAIVGNISKLPHMLIAGTTGSGKSVCMNSLILSLLYKARPDEVKFIMIDPKMVELGIYNSIPHLYVPVVTEPKKAAGALQWSVVEMLKRYRLFSEEGVRDLESYNSCCRGRGEQPLPQVVIVIDELADLMMAASKEVEESICRIAQMGRAAGMHLVIATQRPSADVITGLMKANIPSRIAFAVSSALESRIILDQAGAEKLIGHGDMLYAPIGCGKPHRVQGAFVSDDEREKIIKFISSHSTVTPEVNDEINQFMDKAMEGKNGSADGASSGSGGKGSGKAGGNGGMPEGYDEMLPDAVEVVLEMKSCSVSMLQRRIKLGYSRAARIVDQMEEIGVVGPYEGAKPRSVTVTREEWNVIKAEKLGLSGDDDFATAAAMNE